MINSSSFWMSFFFFRGHDQGERILKLNDGCTLKKLKNKFFESVWQSAKEARFFLGVCSKK